MKRRNFIRSFSLAGLSVPLLLHNVNVSGAPVDAADDFELNEFTIRSLQQKMKSGQLTSEGITRLYLSRIEAIDRKGIGLRSVIEVNPDALAIARSLDEERKQGKVRSELHGIPILLKDNIDTGDRMMTTAGSLALRGHYASRDAFLVKKLREAGAVILGKTNLSEWANFRSTRSSSGWSSRGGQTKNPYALDRNPCGSSSGSGSAVAANLCAAAIGTETNGSIACPSSVNGIVGLKPTVGLVSRTGIIPISKTQDTAGPMTRTVEDAALLLTAMAGEDADDPVTKTSAGKVRDYTKFLDADGLKGKRIGIEKSFLKVHEAVDSLLEKMIVTLLSKGATVVEIDLLDKIKTEQEEMTLLEYEFKDGINRYLANVKTPAKSLEALIAYNREHAREIMPYFRQEIFERSQERKGLDSEEYKSVLSTVLAVRAQIDQVLTSNRLDAICGPTNGPAWCTDLINGDHFTGYGMYSPAAMAGYPHITVPMGYVEALPVGITFFGTAFTEGQLITIAYSYEQATRHRKAPVWDNGQGK